MQRKFELNRNESNVLESLLNVARIHETSFNCVTESYRNFVISNIFKRLDLKLEDFAKTSINLGTGELIVNDEDLPKNPIKAEVKGETSGDRGSKPKA